MTVHSDSRVVEITDASGKEFEAVCSHIENPEGKHLFVIAVAPNQEDKARLVASRGGISSLIKQSYGIRSNNDLDYMEVQPEGNLFRVNLNNLGRGPSVHGEPEHVKSEGAFVSQTSVQVRLGSVKMPTPSPKSGYAHEGTELSEGRLKPLSKTERREVLRENKPVQKPKLKL